MTGKNQFDDLSTYVHCVGERQGGVGGFNHVRWHKGYEESRCQDDDNWQAVQPGGWPAHAGLEEEQRHVVGVLQMIEPGIISNKINK